MTAMGHAVPEEKGILFQLNGIDYRLGDLSDEGLRILTLLKQAQMDIARLEYKLELIKAGQQQLIERLKLDLVASEQTVGSSSIHGLDIQGEASRTIPSTPAKEPDQSPAAFPNGNPFELKSTQL